MKQTAVEWLEEQLIGSLGLNLTEHQLKMFNEVFIVQAKEMEKQQIINSFSEGWLQGNIYGLPEKVEIILETSKKYYNETFKNK